MQRIQQIGEALKELIIDADLRRRAANIVAEAADERINAVQQGVRAGARGIAQVPSAWQAYLDRRQEQHYELRLQAALQAKRNAPVDVQLGGELWEDAPQELRSRLWMALLNHEELVGTITDELDVAEPGRPAQPCEARSPTHRPKSRASSPTHNLMMTLPDGYCLDFSPPEVSEDAEGDLEEEPSSTGSIDTWEMVTGSSSIYGHGKSRLESYMHRRGEQASAGGTPLVQRLLQAITEVPWPIPVEYGEDGRYNTLLQISIGQEEVDDVIRRDIHRTFPEHPQFGTARGQQLLFKVLKAYSLHDLEVGYCQGMAFIAGIMLMSVPEEPAFKLLARLMGEEGVGMRHLFLPGLVGLKQTLRMLEWLLARIHPGLKMHLEEHGVLPVLYASTWLLTAFSCPFSTAFSGRLIDTMLLERRTHILLRAALAVLGDCEAKLLELHDFEELITFLKSSPAHWSPQHSRKVLNAAVFNSVSDDMITAAQHAVDTGFEGSLVRRTSSVRGTAMHAATRAVAAVGSQAPHTQQARTHSPPRQSSPSQQAPQHAAPLESEDVEMDADSAALLLGLHALLPNEAEGNPLQPARPSRDGSAPDGHQ
ncbi:hypothetical protein WJX73_006950 [Symbiochloris irregularis]|uniref:Rab-GAP TBC domain-containing protein n=1 Tax=Symbiochloris irregularis TaxID=706552 RepID=A0AAW1PE09_9CHLO